MVQPLLSCFLALTLSLCYGFVPVSATAAPLSAPLTRTASTFTASTSIVAMAKKSLFSFSGSRPANLGITDGKLAVCPGSPNCVSSQAPETDTEHWIAPLTYRSSPSEAMTTLKSVIQGMERTEIVTEGDNYLYVEFTTPLMGFVDDVEFYVEPNGVIQVRSASRLGQSDLGLNRKRVEAIRAQLSTLESNA